MVSPPKFLNQFSPVKRGSWGMLLNTFVKSKKITSVALKANQIIYLASPGFKMLAQGSSCAYLQSGHLAAEKF